MDRIDLLIPIGFVLIFVSIIVLISYAQLRQKRYILNKLSNYQLEKVKIRFLQSSVGKGSNVGGMPVKAEMYIADHFFFITPGTNGYFNGMYNINLPVIFVKDENQKNELGLNNIIVPDKLYITAWNSVVIKYQKALTGNIKYSIQINLPDKNDIEKLNKLKNWC
ncbi:hypothetical protein [Maribellus maritimus]|uniref:hypothetical protein n=1 Tax=Maribellus maritimus TaxID=2870838 RepID=UPI001EEB6363|nr:hypothetical protein [Maribellus maritimus]MCG6185906.1 hypothetical protein [Maribellus maritimus]